MSTATTDTQGLGPGDVIRIPKGADPQDVRRILHAFDRAKQNAEIRDAYDAMRDQSGRFPDGYEAARETLAERFHVSKRTVERAVTGT